MDASNVSKHWRATHTNYLHPRCLRVVTGKKYLAFNITQGFHEREALCVSPSASIYDLLNKKGLPSWTGA